MLKEFLKTSRKMKEIVDHHLMQKVTPPPSEKTVRSRLNKMKKAGEIEILGSGAGTKYVAVQGRSKGSTA